MRKDYCLKLDSHKRSGRVRESCKRVCNCTGGNYLGKKDFMVLEILLPEMCTKSINKYILNSVIPILVLTAFSLFSDHEQKSEDERYFRVKSHGLSLLSR